MYREPIINETELNNNPLLRKMRDRFTCSGNMTIGEIMLHRAERDSKNASTPATFMAPSVKTETTTTPAAAIAVPIKTIESPMRSSRRALILTCVAIMLCSVVLLAFIIPVFNNLNAEATTNDPAESMEIVNTAVNDTPLEIEAEESIISPSFENVMNSFSSAFGN